MYRTLLRSENGHKTSDVHVNEVVHHGTIGRSWHSIGETDILRFLFIFQQSVSDRKVKQNLMICFSAYAELGVTC